MPSQTSCRSRDRDREMVPIWDDFRTQEPYRAILLKVLAAFHGQVRRWSERPIRHRRPGPRRSAEGLGQAPPCYRSGASIGLKRTPDGGRGAEFGNWRSAPFGGRTRSPALEARSLLGGDASLVTHLEKSMRQRCATDATLEVESGAYHPAFSSLRALDPRSSLAEVLSGSPMHTRKTGGPETTRPSPGRLACRATAVVAARSQSSAGRRCPAQMS